jgi:uncharacterized protein
MESKGRILRNKYIAWLASRSGRLLMACFLVLTSLFFAWQIQFLRFDFEFEKFFPRNNPETRFYQDHLKEFGYDNDFLHVILPNQEGVFQSDFLKRVLAFEKKLKEFEHVEDVFSPVSQRQWIKAPTGFASFPILHPDQPERLAEDSVRIYNHPYYSRVFAKDGKSLAIYISHTHFNSRTESLDFLKAVEDTAFSNDLPDAMLVGKLKAQNTFIDYIESDFAKYLTGSVFLGLLLLWIIFRDIRSAALPFLISSFTLLWLFGFMTWLGFSINLLSSLLPPIIFFVSMSDGVHLLNAIEKSPGATRIAQVQNGVKRVWTPTLLTSVTTAIGFLSLMWINTDPIRELGFLAALGVITAFFITYTLGVVLSLWKKPSESRRYMEIPDNYTSFLVKQRKVFSIAAVLLVLASVPGILRLQVNAYLLDDLPENSEVRQSFEYMDEEYGGAKPWEIQFEITDPKRSIWDPDVTRSLMRLENYLTTEFPMGQVQSPATLLKYLHSVNNGGLPEYFTFPNSREDYDRALALMNRMKPDAIRKLVTENERSGRVVGFIPELGSYETMRRNGLVMKYIEENLPDEILSFRITGTTYLIDKSHEMLSWNLIKGLLTAVILIGIILSLYFRSFKLLIISLIPNLIPLILVAGILGWAGVDLKMTTSIIFTIVFGIAVDDTIHMMSYYIRAQSGSYEERLLDTFRHAGRAMFITTLIVVAGFGMFMLSDFGATYYLGLFVSLSLVIALFIDFTVLPLLLKNVTPNQETK